jgi:hypothetical protein
MGLVALGAVLGVFGFAVHILWFASVLVQAVLFGMLGADLRAGRRGGGLIPEVVTAVRAEVEAVRDAVAPDQTND